MKFLFIALSNLLLLSVFSVSLYAEDAHSGKAIHDENCLNCHKFKHDEKFYTREELRVKDLKGLGTMVRMCDANLGTSLFDEDMDEITDYLNESYYKFPKK